MIGGGGTDHRKTTGRPQEGVGNGGIGGIGGILTSDPNTLKDK